MKFLQRMRLSVPPGTAAQEAQLPSADVCGLLVAGSHQRQWTHQCMRIVSRHSQWKSTSRQGLTFPRASQTQTVLSSMPFTLLPTATVGKKLTTTPMGGQFA